MKLKNANKGTVIFIIVIILTLASGTFSLVKGRGAGSSSNDIKPKAEFKATEKNQGSFIKALGKNTRT